MDVSKAWHYAPAMALYLGRQSLSEREHAAIYEPLAPGQWACQRIESFRKKIFLAEKVNRSEQRAAGHWALRAAAFHAPLEHGVRQFAPNGEDLLPQMRAVHERSCALAEKIQTGLLLSESGRPYSTVLHLGIGGSDLGPRLLLSALAQHRDQQTVHAEFLSNLDYHAVQHTLLRLDPHETLVVIASKSFATQETLLNAQHVMAWMTNAGIAHAQRNCIAVTQRTDRALQWGIPEHQILWMDESIGGRFSLWGPVSITARMALGNTVIDTFIEGGLLFDQHFFNEPPQRNLSALLAMTDFYNLRQRALPSLMVSAYDSRLALLVPYLNQLWMESLGKHVDTDGNPLEGPACPILWGDVGTNAQHAFFQLLHQGLHGVAIELVGIVEPDHEAHESHRALLANLIAQTQALSTGCEDPHPSKSCWGGHPVTVLFLDRCDAKSLGALIALWEHRVECMAALCCINPFDQWGVELGKTIAAAALESLRQAPQKGSIAPQADSAELDAKSLELVSWLKRGA
jgi:glucose-6-phosphate isomerase